MEEERDREEDEVESNDGFCYITCLSTEILLFIFSLLDARSIVRASRACTRLHFALKYCDPLWRRLCRRDYELALSFRAPFDNYYDIYRSLSMSRLVLGIYLSERFYNSGKYGILPGWLWTWIVLNTCSPRIPRWVIQHKEPYLRLKVAELPLGRISKTWNLKAEDMVAFEPARSERGTHYYTWGDVHRAALRKHGSHRTLQEFLMKRCFRAKKHLQKHFELLRSDEPAPPPPRPAVTVTALIGACGFSSFLRTL